MISKAWVPKQQNFLRSKTKCWCDGVHGGRGGSWCSRGIADLNGGRRFASLGGNELCRLLSSWSGSCSRRLFSNLFGVDSFISSAKENSGGIVIRASLFPDLVGETTGGF